MIEAYIAAIFVDSDFDYTVVEAFFTVHIKPYFEDMSLYDTFANRHPTVNRQSQRQTQPQKSNSLTDISLSSVDRDSGMHQLLS